MARAGTADQSAKRGESPCSRSDAVPLHECAHLYVSFMMSLRCSRWQSSATLHYTTALDVCVLQPAVLQLCRRLLGDPVCLTGSAEGVIRDPVHAPAPTLGQTWPPGTQAIAPWPDDQKILWQLWHREQGGQHLPGHPYCITSLQCRFQLSASTGHTHCISTVPESVEAKRKLLSEPKLDPDTGEPAQTRYGCYHQVADDFIRDQWRNRYIPQAVDCIAGAGDVIILNNNNVHAGTVRQTDVQRVDFRVDFGHGGAQLDRRTTSIPPRIWRMAPELQDTGLTFKAATPQWAIEAFKGAGGGPAGGGVAADHGWRGAELQPRDSLPLPALPTNKL